MFSFSQVIFYLCLYLFPFWGLSSQVQTPPSFMRPLFLTYSFEAYCLTFQAGTPPPQSHWMNSFVKYYNQKFILDSHAQIQSHMLLELSAFIGLLFLTIVLLLKRKAKNQQTDKPVVVILLGSGGHTTEMCELVREFRFADCSHVFVITSASDKLSQSFFLNYLSENQPNFATGNIKFFQTLRTNQVLQSKITSVLTTLRAFAHTLLIICRNLLGTTHLISNGPGIAIPYLYIFWFLNKIRITKAKLIFIESWCRVKSVSLSGRLAKFVASEFIVHWPEQEGKECKYYGQVI